MEVNFDFGEIAMQFVRPRSVRMKLRVYVLWNVPALDGVVWHPKHYPEVIEHFKTYWSKETEELEGQSLLLYSTSTNSRLPIRCVSRAFDALGLLAAYCHSSS